MSQRLWTSLPYAGDRSLNRGAFQDNFSSILHYLLHTLALLSSISRATGKIFAIWCRHCKLVSKIPILPCSLGLWAFWFSFDNVFWNSCIHAFLISNWELFVYSKLKRTIKENHEAVCAFSCRCSGAAVQRAVVLCKLDSLSSHGWYNLSAFEFPMPLLLSTSSPREGGIIFVQLYVWRKFTNM